MDTGDPASSWQDLRARLCADASPSAEGHSGAQPSPAERRRLGFARYLLTHARVRPAAPLSDEGAALAAETAAYLARGVPPMRPHVPTIVLAPCRYKRVGVDLSLVVRLCSTGASTQDVLADCARDLPPGTRVVAADVQYEQLVPDLRATLWLTCEHATWPLLTSGQTIPEITVCAPAEDTPLRPAD
jgi:hypothetical protein